MWVTIVQLIGKPFGVAAALTDFRMSAAPIGLELNTTKAKVCSMGAETLSRKSIRRACQDLATIVSSTDGITLMGSPIGQEEWIKSEVMKVVDKNRARLEAVHIYFAQHANRILLCTCVSRVPHLLLEYMSCS